MCVCVNANWQTRGGSGVLGAQKRKICFVKHKRKGEQNSLRGMTWWPLMKPKLNHLRENGSLCV